MFIHPFPQGGPFDAEEFEVRRTRPLVWRTEADVADIHFDRYTTNNLTDNASANANQTQPPASSATGSSCRNSVQGRVWLVDDRGLVCLRGAVHSASGCCDPADASTKLHSCATCGRGGGDNDNSGGDAEPHCCSGYEHCVSCCMNPDKRVLLERVIAAATGRQRAVFATVADHFELCLAKCRTDSHSVQHENQYRRPAAKHCYGLTFAHESQRDVAPGEQPPGAAAEKPAAPPAPVASEQLHRRE